MTQAAEEILQKALQLPEEDSERIADSLLRRLHGSEETTFDEEWGPEIQRRIGEIDEGKVQLLPGDEVMARLRARFAR
jgi:putative addiction module component (TIGR02574 family)